MNRDIVEKIRNSLIQHGKMNDRIYLMKLDARDVPDIVEDLNSLAETKKYTKIFAKVPKFQKKVFLKDGYREEALIPGFFKGDADCVFLGKFLSSEREANNKIDEINDVLRIAQTKSARQAPGMSEDEFEIRKAGPADIVSMGRIYQEVFESYPFPIYDPQYLLDTMKSHVDYFVVCNNGGEIVAVSSAEKDIASNNSEMTDFATLPEYRGKGLAGKLLDFMDKSMCEEGIKTAYTIARALSCGMNITFARNKYVFAGTLVNNTNIDGSIESMNVWYKSLDKKEWMQPHQETPTSMLT